MYLTINIRHYCSLRQKKTRKYWICLILIIAIITTFFGICSCSCPPKAICEDLSGASFCQTVTDRQCRSISGYADACTRSCNACQICENCCKFSHCCESLFQKMHKNKMANNFFHSNFTKNEGCLVRVFF